MINGITIDGFKRFASASFEMGPLTLLTGLNGSGKTSLLQALLLAKEASTTSGTSLSLNGPFNLQLGTAEDVLNWRSSSPIGISFEFPERLSVEWKFLVSSEEALFLDIASRPDNLPFALSGRPRAFSYLSAERLGPRAFTEMSPLPDAELEVGINGEFCAHILSSLGNRVIGSVDRSHPLYTNATPRLLKYEVEQWLSEITRPIEVDGRQAGGAAVVELTFRTGGSNWVKATNMGFGITYALPIVLAGLIAENDGILLIENPEAHLHPAGQSQMGVFLAWLAGRGVQVIVETHSDHVVNGIRRAIAEHAYLDASSTFVHWFGNDGTNLDELTHNTLSINEIGSFSDWPSGFFDQYQIDVSALGRIRRRTR
ncbi:DUF3696 domain-containing protein [Acetobacter thailandicus]|uniref:DUF3696 domain-containing protein n=1 Tax=Acetobacter thailandicus TaxID=1502842 RepID=A0ABT3QHE4_9PROT|nr:DUF3696 domain-containing protein [Acetobacter thailandicus]MCX2564708.1 DUF3696 domain-containing protein [Acetobacter thailandicus]NHN96262.1 DUF3696 domain-containing protein [Acetobacter thailandicus]